MQCEDIVLKSKEVMETELQTQAQQHKENVQKLQKQIRMQVRTERTCFKISLHLSYP